VTAIVGAKGDSVNANTAGTTTDAEAKLVNGQFPAKPLATKNYATF